MGKYFKTTSFYFAAYLFAKEYEIVSITKRRTKLKFVFVKEKNIRQEKKIFQTVPENDERVMIDARKIIIAIKALREKLISNQSNL